MLGLASTRPNLRLVPTYESRGFAQGFVRALAAQRNARGCDGGGACAAVAAELVASTNLVTAGRAETCRLCRSAGSGRWHAFARWAFCDDGGGGRVLQGDAVLPE